MPKSMFTIKGNICADRVILGRALQKPPITQEELALKIQMMGMEDMTKLIISKIEKNHRHVCTLPRILILVQHFHLKYAI